MPFHTLKTLKRIGKGLRKGQQFVLSEKPFIRAVQAAAKGEGREYLKQVGLAGVEVAAFLPPFKTLKVFKLAKGLPLAERISLALTTGPRFIPGEKVVYHGTTQAAKKAILKEGFQPLARPTTFAAKDIGMATSYALKRAAERGGKPAVVAGVVRPKAVSMATPLTRIKKAIPVVEHFPQNIVPIPATPGRGAAAITGLVIGSRGAMQFGEQKRPPKLAFESPTRPFKKVRPSKKGLR